MFMTHVDPCETHDLSLSPIYAYTKIEIFIMCEPISSNPCE